MTSSIAETLSQPRAARTALRNLLWLSGDKFVSIALGLLVFALIARRFGPEGAGQFSYGVALLQATLGLSLVCASAAVLPRLCRLRAGAAASAVANVFVVRLVGSVIAATLVATYAYFAIDDPMRRAVALVMVATVPLLEPFHAFSAYWLSRNQNALPVLARGCALAVRVAVVFVALWAGAQAWVVALAWVAEAVVSASLQSANLRTVKPWGTLARAVRAPRLQRYARFGIRFAAGLWLSHLFLRIDRMWLAERMDPHAFGLYATAMQLVDVWLQVASLLAGSMAPAFLYRALRRSSALRDHWRTLIGLTATGLLGLAGAALIGPWLLADVFGPAFRDAQGYLLAGFAAATLFFIDQFVHISITANARPWLLAVKWGAACATAVATLLLAVPKLGAYAGPLGLALGLVAGWCVVALVRWGERQRGRA